MPSAELTCGLKFFSFGGPRHQHAAGGDEARVPVDGGQREVVGADEGAAGNVAGVQLLRSGLELVPGLGRLQAGRLEQILAVEIDDRPGMQAGNAVDVAALADRAGGHVEDADVLHRCRDDVGDIPVRRCLLGVVDIGVELFVIAAADLLRRQEAEIVDQFERRPLGLEVLQGLFDQGPKRWRRDLQFHAGFFYELRQHVSQRAVIVLVAGHQDADFRAGVFLHVEVGGESRHGSAEASERCGQPQHARALHQFTARHAANFSDSAFAVLRVIRLPFSVHVSLPGFLCAADGTASVWKQDCISEIK